MDTGKEYRSNSPAWIDEFIDRVRAYVFVRVEDNILIKRPNQATRLNDTGAHILKFLLNGGTVDDLLRQVGQDKAREIELFMLAVKHYLEGKLDEFSLNPAVETSEYTLHFSKLPILSELALTYKCNLKCMFCYAGCNCTKNPAGSDAELSLKGFKSIINSIFFDARVPSISFTGGEPTLRPNILLGCIRYARSLGMRVNLITNGTLIDESFGLRLKQAGLDSAQVSIEGITPETHDKLVQHKGAYQKTIRGISILKDQGIHVHTNTTLNQLNAEECLLLPEFIRKALGMTRFSMNLMIPTGSSMLNSGLVIKYSCVGPIIEKIQEQSNRHDVEFMWYSPLPMCIFNTITHKLGNKGCAACDGLLSVAPNGDVLPCASYDQPVGNLVRDSFHRIWQNMESTHFRNKKFAHNLCQQCEHLALCNGGCPLYWRNMGYEELSCIHAHQNVL